MSSVEKNANSKHCFSREEIVRKFGNCRGKTLGEIDKTGVFEGKPKNKGVAGAVIEQSVLGYPPDVRQEPDIKIDGIPYEVKTTGLVFGAKSKGGGRQRRSKPGPSGLDKCELRDLEAKEPMSVTAVSVDEIWKEEFASSAFWHKLEHMLIAYYLYNDGKAKKVDDALEYERFPFIDYELHDWNDDDREVLRSDWQIVRDFVARVHQEGLDPDEEYPKISHELNRKLMYTDTSPKWPNKPRWRLKRSTVTSMVKEHFAHAELERLPVLLSSYADIERVCQDIRRDYGGTTVAELARELHFGGSLAGKSVNEGLLVRMFGGSEKKISRIDTFAKAGIQCKSMTLASGAVRLSEDMKFARIDFDEVMNEDVSWEDSAAKECFEGRFLCAVFSEPSREAPLSENVFEGFKWLVLDDEVVDEARMVWEEVRRLIVEDELKDIPVLRKDGTQIVNQNGVPRSAPNFPKSKDAKAVFVRGDSSDSSRKPLVINDVRMYLQYFWLRKQWVADRLAQEQYL